MNSPQDKTIETYVDNFEVYKNKTVSIVDGEFKDFIDSFCAYLPASGNIFEIGSAQGRDARYIKLKGFNIFCTDIIPQALEELKRDGFQTDLYDFRDNPKDEWLGKFDGFFANAVLLHATQEIFEHALNNIIKILKENGVLAFSLKTGKGEEISLEKMGAPRYFKYYSKEELTHILNNYPYQILSLEEVGEGKWLHAILKKI
jgi:SAM-dependent methyltransferase